MIKYNKSTGKLILFDKEFTPAQYLAIQKIYKQLGATEEYVQYFEAKMEITKLKKYIKSSSDAEFKNELASSLKSKESGIKLLKEKFGEVERLEKVFLNEKLSPVHLMFFLISLDYDIPASSRKVIFDASQEVKKVNLLLNLVKQGYPEEYIAIIGDPKLSLDKTEYIIANLDKNTNIEFLKYISNPKNSIKDLIAKISIAKSNDGTLLSEKGLIAAMEADRKAESYKNVVSLEEFDELDNQFVVEVDGVVSPVSSEIVDFLLPRRELENYSQTLRLASTAQSLTDLMEKDFDGLKKSPISNTR